MPLLASPTRSDRARTCVAACSLAAVAFVLAAVAAPDRLFGNDAAHFVHWIASGVVPSAYHNPLYPKLALALHESLHLSDPGAAMHWLSALGMAIGVGFTTLAAARVFDSLRASIGVGLLVALTPVVWFFGAVIETHALQFAALALATWLTLALDWRHAMRATIALAVTLALAQCAHPTSILFGPGFLMLAVATRAQGTVRGQWLPFLAIGAGLLFGLLCGGVLARRLRGLPPALPTGESFATIREFQGDFGLDVVIETWLAPLAVLAVLQILALTMGVRRGNLRAFALAVGIVPTTAFFLWWSVPERGAYLLGTIPATAVLLAELPRAWRRPWLVVSAIALQGVLAGWQLCRFGSEQRISDRIARLERTLGAAGLVLSASDNAPPAQHYSPSLEEINLTALALQQPNDTLLTETLVAYLRDELTRRPVVLDLSFRLRGGMRGMEHRIATLEQSLRTRFQVRELPDGSWPLLWFER